MRKIITVFVFMFISMSLCIAQNDINVNSPQTIEDLNDTIQKILIETQTPGAAIVMVSGDKVVLLEGIGKANIEQNIDVNENTMFRLGSISKLFVSLAILKLQEDGYLSLKDKVNDIIPDIKIDNPWEDQHPVRIENLLEHTSGLSNYTLAELGSNDPKPKTLKESLEYYPKGRVVKYVPGTRIRYSNLAVSIAAYIVETVSGMTYENYVAKYFFEPMGMKNMTFRYTEQYKKIGAIGYDDNKPMPYLHTLYRPSTALTGSPKELANLLRFFINRGKLDSVQLISDSSLKRMERNESLQIEKSKWFKDNGLGNYATYYKGFAYRGHGGSVPGSNSDFCYLPKYNLGYAIMINGNSEYVLDQLSTLLKEYQTKDLEKENVNQEKDIHKITEDLSGFYVGIDYKFKALKFFEKIKRLQKVWTNGDTLFMKSVLGQYPNKFYNNGNNEYVSEYSNKRAIFRTNDPVEGQVIYGRGILKKISPLYAYTLLTIFWALLIIPVTITLFAFIQLLIYAFGKKKNKIALWICLWPMASISFLIAIIVALFMSIHNKLDSFLLLGNLTPLSFLIFIGTIGFALASLWSGYYIYKNRGVKMSKVLYFHSALAAIFNIIFVIYFLSNGVIGLATWI